MIELKKRMDNLESMYLDLDFKQKNLTDDLNNQVKKVLDHINTRLVDWISTEIRSQLSEHGLRAMIKKIVVQTVDRGLLSDIAEKMGEQIVQGVTKRMTKELENIKNISYSIESELKGIERNLPLGYEESKAIVIRINRTIINSTQKRLQIKNEN